MKKLLLFLPLLLAACATHSAGWTQPGKARQDFTADSSYCESISQVNGGAIGDVPGHSRTSELRYRECLMGKGWTEQPKNCFFWCKAK